MKHAQITKTCSKRKLSIPPWVIRHLGLDTSKRYEKILWCIEEVDELDPNADPAPFAIIRKATPKEIAANASGEGNLDLYLNGTWEGPTDDEMDTAQQLEDYLYQFPGKLDEDGIILEFPFSMFSHRERRVYTALPRTFGFDDIKHGTHRDGTPKKDNMSSTSASIFIAKCLRYKMVKRVGVCLKMKGGKKLIGRPTVVFEKCIDFPRELPWDAQVGRSGRTDDPPEQVDTPIEQEADQVADAAQKLYGPYSRNVLLNEINETVPEKEEGR